MLALKLGLAPLLLAQGWWTRRRMPRLPEAAGPRDGVVGSGPPLRLLVAGDSSAAGVGVDTQDLALAAPLAGLLADQAGVQVHWRLLARSGLDSAGALALLQDDWRHQAWQADLAVVVTGVNDVTGQVPVVRALAARAALVRWLLETAGVRHVAFCPLPPVHAFVGLPQPLRWVAGADARRHDQALHAWAARQARVSCVELQLPLDPAALASDGFHPGVQAYRACAQAIASHLVARLRHLSAPEAP